MSLAVNRLASCSILLISASLLCAQSPGPSVSPLGPDQTAIYRAFFASYSKGNKLPISVSNVTDPFEPDDMDRKGCAKNFPARTVEVHRLPTDMLAGLPAKLVDPRLHEKKDPGDAIRQGQSVDDAVAAGFRAGIFTFSEVAFNSSHDRAAFSYSFVCGTLCGHGSVVIFKLQRGKWVQEKDTCAHWIS
jgi:hypothetical protein